MEYIKYQKEILELYHDDEGRTKTEIARIVFKNNQIPVKFENFRRAVCNLINRNAGPTVIAQAITTTKTNQYKNEKTFVLSAWNKAGHMMAIEEYCTHYKLPMDDISSYKLVSHTGTPYYNIAFRTKELFKEDLTENFIYAAIEKLVQPFPVKIQVPDQSDHVLRIVITDVHIAMETDKSGFGLYGGVWNEKELIKRGLVILAKISEAAGIYGNFKAVHIIDLGDYMDGWDGLTVRKGHDLPQNMDNQKAFDVGMDFKIRLLQNIVELNITNHIEMHNVCNDNHAGAFGYTVNSGVKKFIENQYPGIIQVFNYRKFMDHYIIGRHCFVLCHGKDGENLKFGFKPVLDKKGQDKITEYIEYNNLHGYYITFEKGDSHQQLFDQTTSDHYNYNNYMALSPSSEWVQTNFKRGRSGFSLQILQVDKKPIMQIPVEFPWIAR